MTDAVEAPVVLVYVLAGLLVLCGTILALSGSETAGTAAMSAAVGLAGGHGLRAVQGHERNGGNHP